MGGYEFHANQKSRVFTRFRRLEHVLTSVSRHSETASRSFTGKMRLFCRKVVSVRGAEKSLETSNIWVWAGSLSLYMGTCLEVAEMVNCDIRHGTPSSRWGHSRLLAEDPL